MMNGDPSRPDYGSQWDGPSMAYLDSQVDTYVDGVLRNLPDGPCLVIGSYDGRDVVRVDKPLVVGIDLDCSEFNTIHRCQNLVEGDAESLPFTDGCFGSVVCKSALHHLKVRRGLEEMSRVMKPGAVLVLQEPGLLNPIGLIARQFFPTNHHVDSEKPFIVDYLGEDVSRLFSIETQRGFYLLSVGLPVVFKRLRSARRLRFLVLASAYRLDALVLRFLRPLALVFVVVARRRP